MEHSCGDARCGRRRTRTHRGIRDNVVYIDTVNEPSRVRNEASGEPIDRCTQGVHYGSTPGLLVRLRLRNLARDLLGLDQQRSLWVLWPHQLHHRPEE